jgi:Type II restriction endonuclease EcoO109I
MSNLENIKLTNFIEQNIINPFYESRLKSLQKIKLKDLLKRKNPYLFRAKNLKTGQDLVKEMLDAFLSSSEETIFGNLLERLAVYICEKNFEGFKPKEGEFRSIDLIFNRQNKTYIVGIKSGNKWGNSDSITMMINNLKKTSLEKYIDQEVILVSGICYGQSKITNCKTYIKYQGQAFWEFVSGQKDFYLQIIKPIGEAVKNRDIDFMQEYSKKLNQMTKEILVDFCLNGNLDWQKIVEFNSGK